LNKNITNSVFLTLISITDSTNNPLVINAIIILLLCVRRDFRRTRFFDRGVGKWKENLHVIFILGISAYAAKTSISTTRNNIFSVRRQKWIYDRHSITCDNTTLKVHYPTPPRRKWTKIRQMRHCILLYSWRISILYSVHGQFGVGVLRIVN